MKEKRGGGELWKRHSTVSSFVKVSTELLCFLFSWREEMNG